MAAPVLGGKTTTGLEYPQQTHYIAVFGSFQHLLYVLALNLLLFNHYFHLAHHLLQSLFLHYSTFLNSIFHTMPKANSGLDLAMTSTILW